MALHPSLAVCEEKVASPGVDGGDDHVAPSVAGRLRTCIDKIIVCNVIG